MPARLGWPPAHDAHRAAPGLQQADECLGQRALAAAVRTQDAREPPALHRKRDPGDCLVDPGYPARSPSTSMA
ncbi:MAG: hypothetical protein U5Q44_11525 [Dehalococcoidia bacterium]|nr:hypothetical protein [Dehalococcoidia bacterium]